MPKLTIRFLLISTIFLLISCASTNPVKGLSKSATTISSFKSNYFLSRTLDYIYKTNIEVYGKTISGICIIKRIDAKYHRVVFTTEFGNKLLDFEISAADYKVNFIIEELDRRILIKTLVDDFRILFQENYQISANYESSENIILSSEGKKITTYLLLSKRNSKLEQISLASKRKQKINISFASENDIFADQIIIQHYNLKLRIELNHFKNDN